MDCISDHGMLFGQLVIFLLMPCFVQSLPLQMNSYDCGVWVLATVAAVLRGFDATGLKEVEMADFRHYLHCLVLALPTLS